MAWACSTRSSPGSRSSPAPTRAYTARSSSIRCAQAWRSHGPSSSQPSGPAQIRGGSWSRAVSSALDVLHRPELGRTGHLGVQRGGDPGPFRVPEAPPHGPLLHHQGRTREPAVVEVTWTSEGGAMGASPGRWVRRGCFGAAAPLRCSSPSRSRPRPRTRCPAGAPEVWRGAAERRGRRRSNVNRDALLPVEGVFRFVAPDGDSVYETDLQTGRASLFYPGEGVIQGPNLACGTFGGQFPPEFKPCSTPASPTSTRSSVRADASTHDAATDGARDARQADRPGLGRRGRRRPPTPTLDGSRTSAQMSATSRVLGMPGVGLTSVLPIEELKVDPTVLRIENATSRTDQRIDAGVLVVDRRVEALRRRARRRPREDRLASCRPPPRPTTATASAPRSPTSR